MFVYMAWKSREAAAVWSRIAEKEPAGLIKDYITEIISSGRILDIACGNGRNTSEISQKTGSLTMVDINPYLLKAAKSFAGENSCYVNSDARLLPFRDAAYDTILLIGVLQSMNNTGKKSVLREACRVLGPGGILYSSAMGDSRTGRQGRYPFDSVDEFTHVHEECGFTILGAAERADSHRLFYEGRFLK